MVGLVAIIIIIIISFMQFKCHACSKHCYCSSLQTAGMTDGKVYSTHNKTAQHRLQCPLNLGLFVVLK